MAAVCFRCVLRGFSLLLALQMCKLKTFLKKVRQPNKNGKILRGLALFSEQT